MACWPQSFGRFASVGGALRGCAHSMLMGFLLAAARFAHYTALTSLFGAALFPLYAFVGRGKPDGEIARVLKTTRAASAVAALVSGAAWFLVASANMSGDPLAVFDLEALWFVASETEFGRVTMLRFLLVAVAVWTAFGPHRRWFDIALSAMLLGSIALTGHTQVEKGVEGWIHVTADALHLLAAGAWLGALVPLLAVAAIDPDQARERGVDPGLVLASFSGVGVAAVAILVLSGVVNAWFLVGQVGRLFTTPYGLVLCAKLVLFGLMVVLAAANRFWITAALNAGLIAEDARPWLARLRRHILAEQVLGVAVLVLVGVLGTLEPGAGGDAAP